MELNKCPNCNGKLELAANRKRMVCAFCGSEFTLDDTPKRKWEISQFLRTGLSMTGIIRL